MCSLKKIKANDELCFYEFFKWARTGYMMNVFDKSETKSGLIGIKSNDLCPEEEKKLKRDVEIDKSAFSPVSHPQEDVTVGQH